MSVLYRFYNMHSYETYTVYLEIDLLYNVSICSSKVSDIGGFEGEQTKIYDYILHLSLMEIDLQYIFEVVIL